MVGRPILRSNEKVGDTEIKVNFNLLILGHYGW
jgi:hypothetical protein